LRLALVTDAWLPQVNGVVRTLGHTIREVEAAGHEVTVISPAEFRTVPCPTYPEIRLALFAGREVRRRLAALDPDAIHVATEGPLGLAARNWCVRRRRGFTTAYHTQFPEYVRARAPIPLRISYAAARWFHGRAANTLVATESMQRQLEARGFRNLARWGRGVDTELFRPRDKGFLDLPRPIWLYVGRVAVEKGVEDFLRLDLPGSKLVVGDGPEAANLKRRYPDALFAGYRQGEDLAAHIAACDVFVFPSRTDTFGLVMLEAMACGVPVAAYPVTGPVDVVVDGVSGVLDEDLGRAALAALALDPAACRARALAHSWEACTRQFLAALALAPDPAAGSHSRAGAVRFDDNPSDACAGPRYIDRGVFRRRAGRR
jgi:glycosyltransferase involved in cell wall biosynthesis